MVEDSDPKVGLDGAHRAALTLAAGFATVRDLDARAPEVIYARREAMAEGNAPGPRGDVGSRQLRCMVSSATRA